MTVAKEKEEISKKQEPPMIPVLVIELFDVWVLYFKGLFVSSNEIKYILSEVDYASKLVEEIVISNNDVKSVTAFL